MKIRVIKDAGLSVYSVQRKYWFWPMWIELSYHTNRERAFEVAFEHFHPDVTYLT